MGRRNTTSYDDVLLQKTKAVICEVLVDLNLNGEIEHVEALSSPETNERWKDVSGMAKNDVEQIQMARSEVTFEQFVEYLDDQDQFFKDLVELLVSQTIRKAISKSISEAKHTKDGHNTQASLPSNREWYKEYLLGKKVRTGIRRLTRAVRRSDTWDDGNTSSASSPPSSSDSDSTLSPLDFIPTAPPSVFQSMRTEAEPAAAATTTRASRVAERGTPTAFATRRAELMTQRARLSMQREALLQEARQTRSRRARSGDRARHELARLQRVGRVSSSDTARQLPELPSIVMSHSGDDLNADLVQRFLTQPFPSEARVPNPSTTTSTNASRPGQSISPSGANIPSISNADNAEQSQIHTGSNDTFDMAGFQNRASRSQASAQAMSSEIHDNGRRDGSPDLEGGEEIVFDLSHLDPGEHSLASLLEEASNSTSRLGEFEAFARSRRQGQRGAEPIGRQRRSENNGDEEEHVNQEEETLHRAANTISRADETIQRVSEEAELTDRLTSARTRRFQLPALNDVRPMVRLPSRTRRRGG